MRPLSDGNPTNLRHCTIDRCRHRFYARGLCYRHYLQWWQAGRPDDFDPTPPPRPPLPASFRLFTG